METVEDNVLKISNKLVSEVLGYDVIKTDIKDNTLRYDCDFDNIVDIKIINIYEFAFKCKEWALKYDCMLNSWYTEEQEDSSLGQRCAVCNIYHSFTTFDDIVKSFKSDTEPKAIFKACQWVLTQKDKKC